MNALIRHLIASYLRALAAAGGALQFVVHVNGVSVTGVHQAVGAFVGAAVAPLIVALTQGADLLDKQP